MSGRREFEAPYDGTLWIFINAGGGWDPTSLCDPKGADYEDQPDRMNNYLADDIEEAGNIRYAPVFAPLPDGQQFFDKYYQELLVVNGLDMLTNGHDAGNRHCWSGRLTEGHPSMAAFMAASFGVEQPLAYLSFGGYSETAGLVARTRSGNINVLQRLAYPSRMNPDDENSDFHHPNIQEIVAQATKDREVALLERQGLPRIRQAMSTLFTSRSGSNELRRLTEFLPETFSQNPLAEQGQLALAAYRAGVCVSASLSIGGFDTHGNHDAAAIPRLQTLLEGIDEIMEFADVMGVRDQVILCVGSDFGRTPGYNEGAGKDHWPISSMMFMGRGISGNRVVGRSTDRHRAYAMNLDTLESLDTEEGDHIQPGHICQALRSLAGLQDSELAAAFPIEEQHVNLFA